MEDPTSNDYLDSSLYLSLGYDTAMDLKPETNFFGSLESIDSTSNSNSNIKDSNINNSNSNSIIITPVSSSTSTPLMPSSNHHIHQPVSIKESNSSSSGNLYQQDPQTHEHFLKLLSQIQQNQQTLNSFQTNHDFINAQTAAAVAASSAHSASIPTTATSTAQQQQSSSSSPTQSSVSISPMSLLSDNSTMTIIPSPSDCNTATNPTVKLSSSAQNSPNLSDIQQLQQQNQPQQTQLQAQPQQSTEATITISLPTKKNIKASAIASPPNSPRKNTRNSKIKHKTQQVQQNIQQATSPVLGIPPNPTVPPFKLSGSPPSSSPPQSPLTPPPLPPVTKKQGRKSVVPAAPTGPSVISIINQLGLPTNNTNANNITKPTIATNLSTSGTNIPIKQSVENTPTTTTNNEDKKTVCLSFLKYYFNVNPSLTTPTLRRSLILSLYVNKISQELRYRRPNDMANLCVVLYGYLFSSLDDNTIKEFINVHSSNIPKSKKDDKKRKRKRDKEELAGDKQQRTPLQKSVNGLSNSQQSAAAAQINGVDSLASADWPLAPIQTTPSYFSYDLSSATSPDNSNGVLSPSTMLSHGNSSPGSFMLSDNMSSTATESLTLSPTNTSSNTLALIADDDDDTPVSLHDAFINCLKSCTLLPFLEFKPVHSLTAPVDLPISDFYYSYDDLVRWENELKDLKQSVKQSNVQQQSIQQKQQQAQATQAQQAQQQVQSPQMQSQPQLQMQTQTQAQVQTQVQSPRTQPQTQVQVQQLPIQQVQVQQQQQQQQQQIQIFQTQQQQQFQQSSQQMQMYQQQQQQLYQQLAQTPVDDASCNWKSEPKNGVLVNVLENDDSFIIYVAIPHSRPNTLRVTVNQLEVIIEGSVSIPDTIFLPNGTEMIIPVGAFPQSFQKQEFFVGSFSKHIQLSSPVSSSVVGKREGVVVIIARKDTSYQITQF